MLVSSRLRQENRKSSMLRKWTFLSILFLFLVYQPILNICFAGALVPRIDDEMKSEGNFYMLDSILYCDAVVIKFSSPVVSITSTERFYDLGDIGSSYSDVKNELNDLDKDYGLTSIVKMIPDITAEDTVAIHKITGQTVSIINNSQLFIFKFINPLPLSSVCSDLEDLSNIEYAHMPVSLVNLEQPNDPDYFDSNGDPRWYYSAINIEDAWDITHGSSSITIGVIEWGAYDNHEDYSSKVTHILAEEGHYHSARVAGIAAANPNNNLGIAGIGWNSGLKLYGVDNNSDQYTVQQILSASRYNDVINFSITFTRPVQISGEVIDLTGSCPSGSWSSWGAWGKVHMNFPEIESEIQNALAIGTVVVAAAGNKSINSDLPNIPDCDPASVPFTPYPAAYDGVIAVSETMLDSQGSEIFKVDYNYGSYITMSAPATGFALAEVNSSCSTTGDYVYNKSGTSFGAPMVSGVASLVLAIEPYANVYSVLTQSSDKIGNYSYDSNGRNDHLGFGRLNALSALEGLFPNVPSDFVINSVNGQNPVLSWSPNNETDLDHYVIYRNTDGGSFSLLTTVSSNNTTFTDTEITCSSGKFDPTVCYKLAAVDLAGNESEKTNQKCSHFNQINKDVQMDGNGLTEHYSLQLDKSFPNPFNNQVLIAYEIPPNYKYHLYITDILGRTILTLDSGELTSNSSRSHSLFWDATDSAGKSVESGIYLVHLHTTGGNRTNKILLMK